MLSGTLDIAAKTYLHTWVAFMECLRELKTSWENILECWSLSFDGVLASASNPRLCGKLGERGTTRSLADFEREKKRNFACLRSE